MTKGGEEEDRPKLYCMYRGPGPAYRLKPLIGRNDHCKTKHEAPSYTIGIPYKWTPNEGPGPAYNYDSFLTTCGRQIPPSAVISGRPPPKAPTEITPGPGQYRQKFKSDTPYFGFGMRAKTFPNLNPAPNAYKITKGIGTINQLEKAPLSAIVRSRSEVGGIYHLQKKAAVPGPATYGPPEHRVTRPSIGPYSLKDRYPVKEYNSAKDAPGPGSYDLPSSLALKRGNTMGIRHSEYMMPLITYHDMY